MREHFSLLLSQKPPPLSVLSPSLPLLSLSSRPPKHCARPTIGVGSTPRAGRGPICALLEWRERAHLAEGALLEGDVSGCLRHLEAALATRPSEAEARAIYCRLMRLSRRAPDKAAAVLHDHMQGHAKLQPDSASAHLELIALMRSGRLRAATDALDRFVACGVPLSAGSFDLLIHAAAERRDRISAWSAYRKLRRARLTPGAHTLNALMKAETRARRPLAALRLFERARDGVGWPGTPPDEWSLLGAMSAASAAEMPDEVEALFRCLLAQATAGPKDGDKAAAHGQDPSLRRERSAACSAVAWNMAMRSRLQRHDVEGALELYGVMRRAAETQHPSRHGSVRPAAGVRDVLSPLPDGAPELFGALAPAPRVDTFNTLIDWLGASGREYSWALRDMARLGQPPDAITISTLLRLQPNLASARSVWRWGRRRRVARDPRLWHHLIESYIAHGKPLAAPRLLGLMQRDGERRQWADAATSASSHNLYMRALLRAGDALGALDHFERMAAVAAGEGCEPPRVRPAARWLRAPPAAAPDAHSYSIALTAIRATSDEALFVLAGVGTGANVGDGKRRFASGDSRHARRTTAAALLRDAIESGAVNAEAPPAALAHAAIAACGGDVDGAFAIWRSEVLPMLRSARRAEAGVPAAPGTTPPGQPTLECSVTHALLRVCGAGTRPDEALRVVFAMRSAGLEADKSWWTAYENGKASRYASGRPMRTTSPTIRLADVTRLAVPAYERLLKLECCPEKAGVRLGKLERIRIQFSPPEDITPKTA